MIRIKIRLSLSRPHFQKHDETTALHNLLYLYAPIPYIIELESELDHPFLGLTKRHMMKQLQCIISSTCVLPFLTLLN
jgi:hypothetical protein